MNDNSSNREQDEKLADVIEHEPESKKGTEGQAAHGGRQVGPNSDRAGEPEAPATGDPHSRGH